MPQIPGVAADQLDSNDLISFLKAIPDGRFRRGVRYPQWFLLLVAVLGILSGSWSSRDLEAFAKRHRQEFNQALGLDFKRWPTAWPPSRSWMTSLHSRPPAPERGSTQAPGDQGRCALWGAAALIAARGTGQQPMAGASHSRTQHIRDRAKDLTSQSP